MNTSALSRLRELRAAGRFDELLALLDRSADFTIGVADPATIEVAVLRMCALNALSRWDESVSIGNSALSSVKAGHPSEFASEIHGLLGVAHLREGNVTESESHLRAAVHMATWHLTEPLLIVQPLKVLSVLFSNMGLWQSAAFELDKAIAIADSSSLLTESCGLRINRAVLLLKTGRLPEAEATLNSAEAVAPKSMRPKHITLTHLLRAKHLRMTGHSAKALSLLEPVLVSTREKHYSREEAICLEYMGDCHLAKRDYKTALERYNSALEIANATAPRGDIIPELGHRIGECLVHLGDPNAAILSCERGLKVARDLHDRYEECATHRVMAMAHRAAGNPTKALRMATEGVTLGRSYEIPYELARALAWSGETRLQSHGRDDQMMGRLQLWEARAIFDRIGLENEARTLDRVLGFEEEAISETAPLDAGLGAISDLAGLDRGALRFGIVTTSEEVSQAVATIQSVAPSRIPVLVTGPSGVGKELLARALHQMSDRRKQPFIAVNCGALAPGILESELFGHERGAFTGAVSTREGLFLAANRGTLFLDEIGELSLAAQATILRVLENGELRPMGGDEVRTIDVRIVAATNADLEARVERGSFRRDLYYRLEGVAVRIPPLAEREEDIRCLFRYFFAQAAAAAGKRVSIGDDVEPKLCAYGWPGNVRELKNEIGRAVAMAETGSVLGRDTFLPKLKAKTPVAIRQARERIGAEAEERHRILEALRAHRGNKADAARSLGGMKRTTLLYRMERLGIQPEEYEVNEA